LNEKEKRQVEMHTDFFDRCRFAIDNGFYFEAILMEYAAIESRLEAICGTLGAPCGKNCSCRRDIMISTRIECLRVFRNKSKDIFEKTKLPKNFFTEKGELRSWIITRNSYVHGLFKDEVKYKSRVEDNKKQAEMGYEYARLLYNEAKRIRRLKKSMPELMDSSLILCSCKNCKACFIPE
jgi:hypothetical protein